MEQIPSALAKDRILGVDTELDDPTVFDEVKMSHDRRKVRSRCKLPSPSHTTLLDLDFCIYCIVQIQVFQSVRTKIKKERNIL